MQPGQCAVHGRLQLDADWRGENLWRLIARMGLHFKPPACIPRLLGHGEKSRVNRGHSTLPIAHPTLAYLCKFSVKKCDFIF